MLVTERTEDGRTVVRLRKDWHPGRIGYAWVPPMKRYTLSSVEERMQKQAIKDLVNRRKLRSEA
jgi:hypothetical protein